MTEDAHKIPVSGAEDDTEGTSRRGFLTQSLTISLIGLTAAAGVCLCGVSGCQHRKANTPVIALEHIHVMRGRLSLDIGKIGPLTKVGGSAKVVLPHMNDQILIARYASDGYAALSNRCTHRGAEVEYVPKDQVLRCVNYGHSVYRLNGSVFRGPAPRPLRVYRTLLFGGNLEVFL
ncbi:MAG: Rieske (2Fe-2S) protein [Deltaproteobacteria bacterium]|nr:Rieske (2Fe-2S) protein [Deltaproteobacteria bacterium]